MKRIIATILTASLLLTGCAGKETGTMEQSQERFTGAYIISAEEAKEKENSDSVIFVDTRGAKAAEKETVKNSVVIDWKQIADTAGKNPGDKGWGHVLPAEKLEEILGGLGLDKNKELILFADANAGWGEDGRILWELKACGYTDLKMVDGGFVALKAAGLETSKEIVAKEPVAVEISEVDYTNIIQTDELTQDIDQYKIIDAREADEYNGAQKFGEAKGGHLPGAVNIPYSSLFNKDGKLKSNDEIQKIFDELGLQKDDEIVTYCTGGIRSAFMQLMLEMQGYGNVKNYDGSFYNWAAVNEVE